MRERRSKNLIPSEKPHYYEERTTGLHFNLNNAKQSMGTICDNLEGSTMRRHSPVLLSIP